MSWRLRCFQTFHSTTLNMSVMLPAWGGKMTVAVLDITCRHNYIKQRGETFPAVCHFFMTKEHLPKTSLCSLILRSQWSLLGHVSMFQLKKTGKVSFWHVQVEQWMAGSAGQEEGWDGGVERGNVILGRHSIQSAPCTLISVWDCGRGLLLSPWFQAYSPSIHSPHTPAASGVLTNVYFTWLVYLLTCLWSIYFIIMQTA